jgi:hypothetical protein
MIWCSLLLPAADVRALNSPKCCRPNHEILAALHTSARLEKRKGTLYLNNNAAKCERSKSRFIFYYVSERLLIHWHRCERRRLSSVADPLYRAVDSVPAASRGPLQGPLRVRAKTGSRKLYTRGAEVTSEYTTSYARTTRICMDLCTI